MTNKSMKLTFSFRVQMLLFSNILKYRYFSSFISVHNDGEVTESEIAHTHYVPFSQFSETNCPSYNLLIFTHCSPSLLSLPPKSCTWFDSTFRDKYSVTVDPFCVEPHSFDLDFYLISIKVIDFTSVIILACCSSFLLDYH